MRKRILPLIALLLLCSHDMFLKGDPYFFEPNVRVAFRLFNGTYEKSENSIDRSRMQDVFLLGNGQRIPVDTSQWRDEAGMTILDFETGGAGTWVAGVSTKPRELEMSAEAFNEYLEHDGVLDMLEQRRESGSLAMDARERYSKHVKAIFQVGEQLTDDWKTPLGYPIEFVPMQNPYDLHPGHTIRVQLLSEGEPLANQWVYVGNDPVAPHGEAGGQDHRHGAEADHEHSGAEGASHTHNGILSLKTDAEGIVQFELSTAGVWYLRTIHMVASPEEDLTHESNWATLTFAVGEGHSHEHEAGGHEHEAGGHEHEEGGIPAYAYWLGSLVLIGLLFFWFNRKK